MALFGLFGIGNFGNEASLAAGLEAVARELPGAVVTTISTDPGRVAGLHGVPGHAIGDAGPASALAGGGRLRRVATRPLVEIGRWVSAVRHLRGIDLLLVPGTGILDDFGQRPTQLPLDVFRWSVAARLAACRLAYLSIGAGPINHPVSRRLMRAALAQADVCSYRDDGARAFMASLGRDTSDDEVWPDLVFGLERTPAPRRADPASLGVALGVMDYRGWQGRGDEAERIHRAYLDKMTDLARRLRERGCVLRLVIGDDADLAPAEAIAAALADPDVVVCRSGAFDDVLAAMADVDVVIASRYHNLVAALITGVPAVSISYAPKNEQLMEMAGLGGRCEQIESFRVDAVLDHLDDVLRDREALTSTVRERTDALRTTVRSRLAVFLDGHAAGAGPA